jgi:hypothetical protein
MGLHDGACAARELKSNLTARSAGVGAGASFVPALPLRTTSTSPELLDEAHDPLGPPRVHQKVSWPSMDPAFLHALTTLS